MDRFLKRPSSKLTDTDTTTTIHASEISRSRSSSSKSNDLISIPDSDCNSGPPKKKQKQLVKFRESYRMEWPFIKASPRGDSYALCVPCGVDISIGSGGKDDIKKHIQTNKHRATVKGQCSSNSISTFMSKEADLSVIKAEVLWTKFIIDSNLPMATSDHFKAVLKDMCPDSEIAKKFSCGRTKTGAIASCLAKDYREVLVSKMKRNAFSLGTDGSNDHDSKLYPIVVTINDEDSEQIATNLLCVKELTGSSTAENISQLIIDELNSLEIPIDNCLAFISDNANVMVGNKGGVSTLLKKANNNMVSLGCGCHLINLAAKKSVKCLPLKIDEFLIDIYYYFHHSDKRLSEFKEIQLVYNSETKKILKHCPTRWLCLSASLQRVVELWEPLNEYFKKVKEESKSKTSKSKKQEKESSVSTDLIETWFEEKKCMSANENSSEALPTSRLDRIHGNLSSKRALIYCCFLLWIMPVFDKFNKILQQEKPLIHNLRDIYLQLYRELLTKFIQPDIILKNKHDITGLDIEDENYHIRNKDLFIGVNAHKQLSKLKSKYQSSILSNIKSFYISALQYLKKNFPLNNEILQHAASFLNINNRSKVSFQDIMFFLPKIPSLDCSVDELHCEFTSFQSADLPDEIWNEERVDKQWNRLSKHRNLVDHSLPFKNLSKVALSILTIPHSNAMSERIFSLVRKNRTEVRASMGTATLDSMLVCKVASASSSKFTPSSALLKKCKRATVDSLQSKNL